MKTSIDILKTWFQTGDKPTENQFENLIDSFHHKDDGNIITQYQIQDNGNVSFTFSDGNTASIEKFVLPNTMPQNFIDGLVETLNSKVNKQTGKQLSDENFSLELKQKLEGLQNYIHPEFHQITDIEGLQEAIESKVDIVPGKQLSDENFSTEEKEKLAGLENYVAPDSKPISYIEELEETITKINQDLENKVDLIEGKQLSDENFSTEEKEKLANFNISTFSSISDGENRIIANGQADELIFDGITIDSEDGTIKIDNLTHTLGTKNHDFLHGVSINQNYKGKGRLVMTNGSNNISGIEGTEFLKDGNGDVSFWYQLTIITPENGAIGIILSEITSDTSMTLSDVYEYATDTWTTTWNFPSGEYTYYVNLLSIAKGQGSNALGESTYAGSNWSFASGNQSRATGSSSHATGDRTSASGSGSRSSGHITSATGHYSDASGYKTLASGKASHAEGTANSASGNNSHSGGIENEANSFSETSIGMYGTKASDGNPTSIVLTDRIFNIGIGNSNTNRADALTVFKNGKIIAPSYKIAEINEPKSLITKEYADANYSSSSGATDLSYKPSPVNGIIYSSTGNETTIPSANATNAGLMKSDFYEIGSFKPILTSASSESYSFNIQIASYTRIGNLVSFQIILNNINDIETPPNGTLFIEKLPFPQGPNKQPNTFNYQVTTSGGNIPFTSLVGTNFGDDKIMFNKGTGETSNTNTWFGLSFKNGVINVSGTYTTNVYTHYVSSQVR
ncbi:hypothetical protein ACSIGC_16465 [Tenacibaculum sp. ZS6-P6]|uniref:hypothetical protein n=1 Tax=Tenacibaculum sp. ZS6-P6 TaxID=3447503 RepID=UPI003F9C235D